MFIFLNEYADVVVARSKVSAWRLAFTPSFFVNGKFINKLVINKQVDQNSCSLSLVLNRG